MATTDTSFNLLKIDGEVFNTAKWTVSNASLSHVTDVGMRSTSFKGASRTDGFLLSSLASGELSVISSVFAVDPAESYLVTGIVAIGSKLGGQTCKVKVEYFDTAGGAGIAYAGETVTDGEWVASTGTHEYTQEASTDSTASAPERHVLQLRVHPYGYRQGTPYAGMKRFWVPQGASYARVTFSVASATAAEQGFVLSDVSVAKVSDLLNNPTLNTTYNLLPEFMRSDDENEIQTGNRFGMTHVLKRFMAATFAYGIKVGEEIVGWHYERAEDSLTNTESNSTLTDPLLIKEDYLPWLAQMLGVVLTNPFTGLNMWIALPGWNDTTDQTNWESIDLLDAASAEDSVTWTKVRSSVYENVQAYRYQILYGYNGINAGKPESMRGYLKTILDTNTPDSYFTRVKGNDRETPFLLKYVYDSEVDPDPDGTRVNIEMKPTLGMGVVASQSSRLSDAGVIAYEAKNITEKNIPGSGAASDDDTVLILGTNACMAIPDQTGSGRHISLVNASISDPKASQYGLIAGARYEEGFAFYPSATTGSGAHINMATNNTGLSGSNVDYIFHVSDIAYGNSSDIILFEQGTSGNSNYRACVIDETGILKYLTGASGSADSTAFSASTHPAEYDFTTAGNRWIRISATSSTTKFYVGPSMIDVCHPTTHLINSVSLSSPNVYDNSLAASFFKVAHASNGIVGYRAIVNNGVLDSQYAGFSLSTVSDFNLTTYTGTTGTAASTITELYDGVDDFDQDSTLNTGANTCKFNIAYEASPNPIANWIVLPHTGTDYLYMGNQSSSGDSIVVSGMDSDTYNWTVTYTDGTTATGTASSVTTITWSAGTYGGKQIASIAAVGTKTYTFLPSIITAHTATASTGTDTQSGTWTINRAWEAADAYEFSTIVDRDLYQTNREGAGCAPNLSVSQSDSLTMSLHYRRFKTDSGNDNWIFKHPNFQMKFSSSGVTLNVTDAFDSSTTAINTATLTWDDTSRVGQWNYIALVRDVVNTKIHIYANGSLVGSATDTSVNGTNLQTGSATGNVVFHTDNEPGWQFNHFAIFKEALSATDIERVRQTLPT